MNRHLVPSLTLVAITAGLVTGCSGKTTDGTASPTPTSPPTAVSSTANDAPKVSDPLPASALNGKPCETALTTEQVTGFIGAASAPELSDFETGPKCNWTNAAHNGAAISVYYDTKVSGGLNLEYQNTKPQASRWDPTTLQGYPAVVFTSKGFDQNTTATCSISVGIRDDLTYGVGVSLGDSAKKKGVDSCEAAKDVANTVLTNLKARR